MPIIRSRFSWYSNSTAGTTGAADTVVEPYLVQTAIHKGPMLRHIDARMITNPRFQRYALDLAAELGIQPFSVVNEINGLK